MLNEDTLGMFSAIFYSSLDTTHFVPGPRQMLTLPNPKPLSYCRGMSGPQNFSNSCLFQ